MWSCNSQRHQKYLKMFIFQKVTKTQIKSLLILLIVFLLPPYTCTLAGIQDDGVIQQKWRRFSVLILHYWFCFNFSCVTTDDNVVVDQRLTPYAYNVVLLKLKWIFIAWCTCNLVLLYYFEVRGGLTDLAPSQWLLRMKWFLVDCYYLFNLLRVKEVKMQIGYGLVVLPSLMYLRCIRGIGRLGMINDRSFF